MDDDLVVVFISSMEKDMGGGRLSDRDIARQAVEDHPLTRCWFWESRPSDTRPPSALYLPGVRDSDLFLLILGRDISASVEKEYDEAQRLPGKPVLVQVRVDYSGQEPRERMSAAARTFLDRVQKDHSYKCYVSDEDLRANIQEALGNELTRAYRLFYRTPIGRKQRESGSPARFLFLGAGEIGTEIARSLRRYSGNSIVLAGVDRYATPPGRDELHEFVVLADVPWSIEALRARVAELAPTLVIPELMAVSPGVFQGLEEFGFPTVPKAATIEMLIDRRPLRGSLDAFLRKREDVSAVLDDQRVSLAEWRPVDTQEEFETACSEFGLPLFLKPGVTDLGLGQSLVESPEEMASAWLALDRARSARTMGAVVERFVSCETEIYQPVVIAPGSVLVLPPVEYSRAAIGQTRLGGPWQLDYSVQPPILSGRSETDGASVLSRIAEVARVLGKEWLDSDGFFGFDFLVEGENIWLNDVTFRPDINGIVTLHSQRPSLFDIYAKLLLGHEIKTVRLLTPAACCPIVNPSVSTMKPQNWVVTNADELRGDDIDVYPIDKQEVNARERVAFVAAVADSPAEALRMARGVRDRARVRVA